MELDHEIPVANCIHRVPRDAVEPEQLGDIRAVELDGAAGQRTRPERTQVRPPGTIGQPGVITLEHFHVGQ